MKINTHKFWYKVFGWGSFILLILGIWNYGGHRWELIVTSVLFMFGEYSYKKLIEEDK